MNTTKQPDALLKTASHRTEIKKKVYQYDIHFCFTDFRLTLIVLRLYCILKHHAIPACNMCICLLQIETMESQVHARSARQNKPWSKFKNYIVKCSILNITFHSRTTAHMECVNTVFIWKFLNRKVWILTFTAFGNKSHLQRKTSRENEQLYDVRNYKQLLLTS